MTDDELRDLAIRAAMAGASSSPALDPFVIDEEVRASMYDMGLNRGYSEGSGGLGVYPFKCEPYDHYASGVSGGQPGESPDFRGYRFYLPENSLMHKGEDVQFKKSTYKENDDRSFTPNVWQCWNQISQSSSGTVYCKVYRVKDASSGQDEHQAVMELGDEDAGIGGTAEDLVYKFPVCVVGIAKDGKSRKVDQLVVGKVTFGDNKSSGCFAIDDNGRMIDCYYWNGSQMLTAPELSIGKSIKDQVLALTIQSTATQPQYVLYDKISDLNTAAAAQDIVIIPLYMFDGDGDVKVDFRAMPRGDSWAVIA